MVELWIALVLDIGRRQVRHDHCDSSATGGGQLYIEMNSMGIFYLGTASIASREDYRNFVNQKKRGFNGRRLSLVSLMTTFLLELKKNRTNPEGHEGS